MINNTRRNRNIGTSKQRYGQNNRMKIPSIWYKNETLHFTEHLNNYRKEVHFVNDHEFIFIIEETLTDYKHACSVQYIVYLLQFVPKDDYDDLHFIVFRQPKRKEVILSSVWGRLNVRNTQLYRTIIHEFGHYVHYLNIVVRPELDNEELEEWEKRSNYYFNLTSAEKEIFAHNYADKLQAKLSREGIIPFGKKGE